MTDPMTPAARLSPEQRAKIEWSDAVAGIAGWPGPPPQQAVLALVRAGDDMAALLAATEPPQTPHGEARVILSNVQLWLERNDLAGPAAEVGLAIDLLGDASYHQETPSDRWSRVHRAAYGNEWVDPPIAKVCVVAARYGGCYEGGRFVAIPVNEIDGAAFGDDISCSHWWDRNRYCCGVGATPNDALLDLYSKTSESRE